MMFMMLGNLTKAAVSVAVTPVTAAADLAMAIPDAEKGKEFMNRTKGTLENAGDCLEEAVKPDKGE